MDKMAISQQAGCSVSRNRRTEDQLTPRGRFVVEHWRNGQKIGQYEFPNGITNEGKNKLLDVMFHAATAITTWYVSLIDNSGYTALAAGDTYASHAGWTEFTNYSQAARPQWTVGAASGQQATNASPDVFDIGGSGTVKGLAIYGGGSAPSTKGDTAGGGTLWATALFASGDVAVSLGDQLKVTYTVST